MQGGEIFFGSAFAAFLVPEPSGLPKEPADLASCVNEVSAERCSLDSWVEHPRRRLLFRQTLFPEVSFDVTVGNPPWKVGRRHQAQLRRREIRDRVARRLSARGMGRREEVPPGSGKRTAAVL